MNKKILKSTVIALFVSILALICKTPLSVGVHSQQAFAPSKFSAVTNNLKLANPKREGVIRILSYNLLADSLGFDGTNAVTRADGVCEIINTLTPDVVGLQETSRSWHTCLREKTEYAFIHPLRTEILGTMTCVIYNKSTVTLISDGEKVFQSGFDSRLRRMVWGVFRHKKSGEVFAVVNTHFSLSNNDIKVPMKQATELLSFCDNIREKYACPVFSVGDFNARERTVGNNVTSSVYETLCTVLNDAKTDAESVTCGEKQGIYASSNDHIFYKGEADIKNYVILSQKEFEILSDHYPVFVDIFI